MIFWPKPLMLFRFVRLWLMLSQQSPMMHFKCIWQSSETLEKRKSPLTVLFTHKVFCVVQSLCDCRATSQLLITEQPVRHSLSDFTFLQVQLCFRVSWNVVSFCFAKRPFLCLSTVLIVELTGDWFQWKPWCITSCGCVSSSRSVC